MSIKDVIHIRRMLYIYNENRRLIGSINAFDGLIEFSSDSIKVSHMDRILTYDANGILRATARKPNEPLDSELLPSALEDDE